MNVKLLIFSPIDNKEEIFRQRTRERERNRAIDIYKDIKIDWWIDRYIDEEKDRKIRDIRVRDILWKGGMHKFRFVNAL